MRQSLMAPLLKFAAFVAVTLVATVALATTITSTSSGGGTTLHAIFADATSLNAGDDVRIAGVKVGQVTEVQVENRTQAKVTVIVEGQRSLPVGTAATIRYRNLVGSRYVALTSGVETMAGQLQDGDTIPLERTTPALDLTELFDGFRPLFRALSPNDINALAGQIIQIFQGEGGTIDSLVASTASLTQTIADKDQVIGQLIDSLTVVLGTVNQRADEFDSLIVNLKDLVSGLSQDKDAIGSAVTSLADLTDATAGLLEPLRPEVAKDLDALTTLTSNLNSNSVLVGQFLTKLPPKLRGLIRTASYGGWFQFFLCGIDIAASPGNTGLPIPEIKSAIYTSSAQRCTANPNNETATVHGEELAAARKGGN